MKTTIPRIIAGNSRGWVLYDGECPFCIGMVCRFASWLDRTRFTPEPLQAPWVRKRLGLLAGRIPEEMIVLTAEGAVLGGVDGIIYLLRWIWWTRPFSLVARIPGIHGMLKSGYRRVARNRHCLGGMCRLPRRRHRGTASFYEMP